MSDMLDMLEKEFVNLKLTEGNTPELVRTIADSMHSTSIPYRMKLVIAYSELILFFSQFRINIAHWNGSSIPINAITFCIAKSGASKDSSVNACRKCFKAGYDYIEKHRKATAVKKAIAKAREAGVEDPESWGGYKSYYETPNPLFVSISTPEGLVQHWSELKQSEAGSGYVYSGEIGQEMSSNPNFSETIKLLAEVYDEGKKEAKIIKNKDQQNKAISEFPVSALFMGSPSNILYEDSVKKKFKIEFTSKLARRSFFIFANEDIVTDEVVSVKDLVKMDTEIEDKAIQCRNDVNAYIESLVKEFLTPSTPKVVKVSNEVRELFLFYMRYNKTQAANISERLPITKISREHFQWKAFKLSGALALSEASDTITLEHYRAGIEFCELIADDIHNFELELVKEPYELFCNYCHEYQVDGLYEMSLHELKKAGFISNKGLTKTAMTELVKLANSCDKTAEYSFNEKQNSVRFELTGNTDTLLCSYLECTGSKESRAKKCVSGYQVFECPFSELEKMLEIDCAYTCFKFSNGIRGKDNIISNTRWLIFDVDDTISTDEECHLLLEGINHYIVRSSNKDNPYKYRVLIELDKEINIPDYYWIYFMTTVSRDLGFDIDKRPKSQIFFSYSDRKILKEVEASPLEIQPYLDELSKYSNQYKPYVLNDLLLTKEERNEYLNDPLSTFHPAYEAKDSEGSRKLIWAIKRCRELGSTKAYAKDLIYNISQKYWVKPLPMDRLETMYRQIDRMEGFKELSGED